VTKDCNTQSKCTVYVKEIQTFHIESNWSDIGYNFLVVGDGLVYIGRDWNYVGAHTYGFNNESISFIGTFNSIVPPETQLHAAQNILELGVKAGKITPNYVLSGYQQTLYPENPGRALYNKIKTLPLLVAVQSLDQSSH